MHVAGHNRVHVHQDGTRHVHQGGKSKAAHVHKDGTTHNHQTGEHKHADGQVHQHKKEAKSQMCLDQMACCPPEGMKANCCPSCGSAKCTCCGDTKAAKPATPAELPAKSVAAAAQTAEASSLPKTLATLGAGLAIPPLGVGILGSRLWSWLKENI